MTGETVLIAALSGRALAASARRAGLTPLVVDAFGDADTRENAGALRCLPEALHRGFRAGPLRAALDAVCSAAPRQPIGLVLGSGFEDTPKLVAALADRYKLIGNDGETIARAKRPATLFPLLDRLNIAHPETRLDPPSDPSGWLSKRTGASGGAHVLPCARVRPRPGRYYQRRIGGEPASLLAISDRLGAHIVGFTQQHTTGTGPRPFRYAGAAGPATFDADMAAQMTRVAEVVTRTLSLTGLVSFDFLLTDGTAYLLEVNPRPSATIDVFDDADGALFSAHVAACQGRPVTLPEPQAPRAIAILYADAGAVRIKQVIWPPWTADRPSSGTRIARYRPVATVFASAETIAAAQRICRQRLEDLAEMLYGRAPDRERNNAKTDRPRRERLGASSQAR